MKQTHTLSFVALSLAATAQPTIQFSSWPTAAVSLTAYTVTNPQVLTEPTDGANQTWDLSAAIVAVAGTALLEPAAGTPYAATYPAANWAFSETPTGLPAIYNYLLVNSTAVENVVSNVPASTNVYTDYERVLQFPLSLGGSFTDSYVSTNHTGTTTWMFSGTGTMITSLGTFSNQLKMKGSTNDLVLWNASPLYPRLIVNSGGVTFFGPSTTGIAEQADAVNTLHVFPIPATKELNISGTEGASLWSVFDTQGRVLLNGISVDAMRQHIDVSSLTEGNYTIWN